MWKQWPKSLWEAWVPAPEPPSLWVTPGKSPCSSLAGHRPPPMQAGPLRNRCVLPRAQSRPREEAREGTPIEKSLGCCPETGQNQPPTATRLGFRHAFSRWQETGKQQVERKPKKRTKYQQKAQSDSRCHGEGSPHCPSCKAWAEPSRQASGAEWESTDSARGHLHSGRNTPWGLGVL